MQFSASLTKIQQPFIIKVLEKLGIQGTLHNILNVVYRKSKVSINLDGEKIKVIPLKSDNKIVQSLHTSSPQYLTKVLAKAVRQLKEVKRNTNWKGRSHSILICRYNDSIHK